MGCIRSRVISADDFVSEAIKAVSDAAYAVHVDLILPDGRYLGAHASGGIEVRPVDYCKPIWERRYSLPCTDQQEKAFYDHALSRVGEKYDFKDIVGIMLHRDASTRARSICSQFAFEEYWAVGIELLNVLPEFSGLVTPEMFHLSPLFIGKCYYAFPGKV